MAATPQKEPGIHKLEKANPQRVNHQRGRKVRLKTPRRGRKSRRK